MNDIYNYTFPKGFYAAGGFCGIKRQKKDISLIKTEKKAVAAGCFTTNKVKAAPVVYDMEVLDKKGEIAGIVINSGNANACTGEQGLIDTKKMAEQYASQLGARADEVLICSTGVIGVNLPMEKIMSGITDFSKALDITPESFKNAAEAIMTTDTFMKTVNVSVEIGGKEVNIFGMAKGSGMIHPNMATMLSFILTDADITRENLQDALTESTGDSYNMISVDGDTSTNDTVLVLANGMAGNKPITEKNEDYNKFFSALNEVNVTLAKLIARDGEGATKLIEATANGAISSEDAKKIAKSVISSSLFKAAMFGEDANWGRALCAMGYSGGEFDPSLVTLDFYSFDEDKKEEIRLIENGEPIVFDEDLAKRILKRKDIFVDINLKQGEYCATAWGCDLTYDYVKINGDYRS